MTLELEPFRKVHVIFGRGFPVELQNNLTSSASLTKVSWEIYAIDGATKNEEVSMRTQKSLKKPLCINLIYLSLHYLVIALARPGEVKQDRKVTSMFARDRQFLVCTSSF